MNTSRQLKLGNSAHKDGWGNAFCSPVYMQAADAAEFHAYRLLMCHRMQRKRKFSLAGYCNNIYSM